MYEISLANRLAHALDHFVTDRASLFTDNRMSVLANRAKYKECQRQFASILLTIIQLIHVPLS